jgi:hypothetical protein
VKPFIHAGKLFYALEKIHSKPGQNINKRRDERHLL